ncbi:phosphotransferase [Paracoccus suum]|uniref:phosphotransferase n=1 Tax=Paracoccus suum TaxID=2259340 RepID=UPI0013B06978|nr:phosphotransferase [Paracoccus suum]
MSEWTADRAEELAAEVWGVRGRARPLASERDENFRIDPADGGTPQVLKITHPDEDPAIAAFQSEALVHARTVDPSLPVPSVLPTLSGAAWHRLDGARPRIARMVGWLDGSPLADAPVSASFRDALGGLIARLDLALAGFAGEAPRHDNFVWDLSQAANLRALLKHVPDGEARAMAARALDFFVDEVEPRLGSLRRQVIHNDMNPHNVLIDRATPQQPSAIIDFGDMVEGPLVNELGIALAYQPVGGPDPLAAMADLLGGYARRLPLLPAEIEVLPGLIAARRATTVVVSSWRAASEPRNSAYLLRNMPGAVAGLSAFATIGPGAVAARLAAATGEDRP